jgi:hypothetical protein
MKGRGDKSVFCIISVDSHDELAHMLMALMLLSANLIFEELSPVREYTSFAENMKKIEMRSSHTIRRFRSRAIGKASSPEKQHETNNRKE